MLRKCRKPEQNIRYICLKLSESNQSSKTYRAKGQKNIVNKQFKMKAIIQKAKVNGVKVFQHHIEYRQGEVRGP